MKQAILRLRNWRDSKAVAAIEFAVALPVFLMATLGIFDLAYQQYADAVLQGVVEKAGRDGTLEGYAGDQSDLDTYIRTKVREVWPHADVTITRESFSSFRQVRKGEKFTDANSNGVFDAGECFQDTNGNGVFDKKANKGRTGNGGADDIVLLTTTITMDRIFPGWQFINQPQQSEVVATMVLKNQPYAAGAEPPKMICGGAEAGDDDHDNGKDSERWLELRDLLDKLD
jgi:Flp pilus assembly protein TadG